MFGIENLASDLVVICEEWQSWSFQSGRIDDDHPTSTGRNTL